MSLAGGLQRFGEESNAMARYLGHGFDLEVDAVGQDDHVLAAASQLVEEEGAVEDAVFGLRGIDVGEDSWGEDASEAPW